MSTFVRSIIPVAALLAAVACAPEPPSLTDGQGARVEVRAAALSLSGVTNARWRITVENGANPRQVVWAQEVDADAFGDGVGAIAYVGPCDASSGVADNVVTVELLALYQGEPPAPIPAGTWRNPGPLTRTIRCLENQDVAAEFNVTILRDAVQGFFDIAVNFADVFCSAKLDCQDELLLYPADDALGRTGRGPTAVIGFACTGGRNADGTAKASHLYLDAIVLACPGEDDVRLAPTSLSPQGGNLGPVAPWFFQTAVYPGREAFADLDKCYWNLALGLEPAALAGRGCRLQLTGTASSAPLTGGATDPNHMYPVITWDVPLGDDGASCAANALDAEGSGVTTGYTDFGVSERFAYQLTCDDEPDIETFGNLCVLEDADAPTRFTEVEGLVTVERAGLASATYALPAGLTLAGEGAAATCCVDPCCGTP